MNFRKRKKVFIILIALVGVYLSFNLAKGTIDSYQNAGRLLEAEKKLNTAQDENDRLKTELKYRQSAEFVEKEAREKLGLAKKGETVVIPPLAEKSQVLADQDKVSGLSNPEKWWVVFGGN